MVDVENQLRALAESVGMPVEKMWEGVTRGEGGVILKIDWRERKDLKGTLPVGDLFMPFLTDLCFKSCTNLTGTLKVRMSDGHIYLISFGTRTSSFLTFSFPLSSPFYHTFLSQALSTRSCSPKACRA